MTVGHAANQTALEELELEPMVQLAIDVPEREAIPGSGVAPRTHWERGQVRDFKMLHLK